MLAGKGGRSAISQGPAPVSNVISHFLMQKAFLCFLLLFALGQPLHAESPAPRERHVILVTLDGFPAWLWRDPSLPAPNLRKLAAEGASAEAMTVSNPSITWINHTTLVTGVTPRRHGVLYNGLLVRQGDKPPKIDAHADRSKLVFAPTIYDVAHQAGLSTAEVDWVAVTHAPNLDWRFPERPSAEGKTEQELIAAGIITAQQCGWFGGSDGKNSAWRDQARTQAAIAILKMHRPHLMLFHLLNTDAVHHQNGPGSLASFSALAYADRLVGDLVQGVKDAELWDSTTLIVTSDHGFKTVEKHLYPNVALKKAGLASAIGNTVTKCEAVAMTEGGMAFVYVTDPAKKAELLPKLKELFTGMEGIEQVVDGADGPKLGMPTPEENQAMGDLVLFAKSGYAFSGSAAGQNVVEPVKSSIGTHGYLASDPQLDGIFIAHGVGIKKGVVLPRVVNLDVAPTIAELLHLTIPNAEGRAMDGILAP